MSEINKTAVAGHPAVGKLHQVKGEAGGAGYRVAEHLPKFDFGVKRGGRKDAFRIVRESHNTESIVPADGFLATHDEVKE